MKGKLSSARKQKSILEARVFELVEDFQDKVGLHVSGINVYHDDEHSPLRVRVIVNNPLEEMFYPGTAYYKVGRILSNQVAEADRETVVSEGETV